MNGLGLHGDLVKDSRELFHISEIHRQCPTYDTVITGSLKEPCIELIFIPGTQKLSELGAF